METLKQKIVTALFAVAFVGLITASFYGHYMYPEILLQSPYMQVM